MDTPNATSQPPQPKSSLDAILDAVSEPVFVLDENRRVQLNNRAARELFGGSFKGQDFVRAVRHPDCLRCVDAVLAGEENAETVVTLPKPVLAVCRVSVTAIAEGVPSSPRVVVSIDDISQVLEARKMRSDFVANVSHELRSPLTALSGFIETLKGAAKDDPDARNHFLTVMEREALRMDRLIDDLLSLSKVETNARIRPTEHVDLAPLIEQVAAALTLQAKERGKSIEIEDPGDVPPVLGDSDELMQIFRNLIENAIKYSQPETAVTVSLGLATSVAGIRGAAVRVDVQDRGAGIARSHIPRLTERFYRVDDGRARAEGGTGLGLAIVKHIVSRHRGRLQIASEVGRGSTFSVYLPVEMSAV